jgi:hypothetical protein
MIGMSRDKSITTEPRYGEASRNLDDTRLDLAVHWALGARWDGDRRT